jgi:TPR repeat protein
MSPVFADDGVLHRDAWRVYEQGNHGDAIRVFERLAASGHVSSQRSLGIVYRRDNPERAIFWLRKASDAGDAASQNDLANIFSNGTYVQRDLQQALIWYQRAASQGYDQAQMALAFVYEFGRGVPKNSVEAYKWYTLVAMDSHSVFQADATLMRRELARTLSASDVAKAQALADAWRPRLERSVEMFRESNAARARGDHAEAFRLLLVLARTENPAAQNNLGAMYQSGEGTSQDFQQALFWFRKAAGLGHSRAQMNLGLMYRNGQGIVQDFIEAHKWFNLAASSSDNDTRHHASLARDAIAQRMTPEQVAAAQARAIAWRPEPRGGR